jgi:hypothetical protein
VLGFDDGSDDPLIADHPPVRALPYLSEVISALHGMTPGSKAAVISISLQSRIVAVITAAS